MRPSIGIVAFALAVAGLQLPVDPLNYSTFIPTRKLTITVMTDTSGPPTKPRAQNVIVPLLREKTGVTATVLPLPQGGVDALIAGHVGPDGLVYQIEAILAHARR